MQPTIPKPICAFISGDLHEVLYILLLPGHTSPDLKAPLCAPAWLPSCQWLWETPEDTEKHTARSSYRFKNTNSSEPKRLGLL